MNFTIKRILWIALTGLCFSLWSCKSEKTEENSEAKAEKTDDVSETNAGKTDEEPEAIAEQCPINLTEAQKDFVNGNNAFTLKFLKTINDYDTTDNSFFYSPLSIVYVLSMVNDAAEGTTRQELEKTMGFRKGGIEAINEYCKTLIDSLPKVDARTKLHIANAVFVNDKYKLKSQFQKDMQTFYDANAESLNFSSPTSLNRINGWCNDKTNGLIPDILEEIDPIAVSYLLNAIYFKANWAEKFDEFETQTETFTTPNDPIPTPLMHKSLELKYFKNETFASVDIPYGNEMWSMTVMLPEEGKNTNDVIDYLNKNGLSFLTETRTYNVDLKLPRFETESTADKLLIKVLEKMGMQRVFAENAEIPNMCDDNLFINMMRQKAIIKVNETGTEAAVVTVAGTVPLSAKYPSPKAVFYADHPFVYVIREASTGVVLFVGKFTGLNSK